MNTCKTCKHWDRWIQKDRQHYKPETFVGSCDFLGSEPGSEPGNDLEDNIRVYDDSLPVTTEGNFGCIHHNKKI